MTSAIEAKGLVKQVTSGEGAEPLTILSGLELQIQAGESVAIVGSSGSGKTTLLSLLAGLDTPSAGSIRLDGETLEDKSEDACLLYTSPSPRD